MESIVPLLTPKSNTFYLNEKATVRQTLETFDANKYTVVPLLDENGHYLGTISEGDILRFIKNQHNFNVSIAENFLIKDIDFYRPYKSVMISSTLLEVYALLLEQNFVPVVDDKGVFIGIIKRKEVLMYLFNQKK